MFRLLCVAWLIPYSEIYGNQCSSSHYEISDVCDLPYGNILTTLHNIRTITECATMCSDNNQCLSIKADVVKKQCHLNSAIYSPMNAICPTSMVKYAALITHNSCLNLIHKDCTFSNECSIENSLCVGGKCQCDHGYSYNHNNDSCLTSCDVYGSTFTLHSGHRIRANNEKNVLNLSSGEECAKACALETSFVCVTVDYRLDDKACHLSRETALTVPLKYWQGTDHDHYQRNCQ